MSEVIERAEQSTDLVTLPAKDVALAAYSTPGGLDHLIEEIRAKVKGTVYDMTTAKGRSECASDAFKVARSKTAIEKLGKALSAEYKEIPKRIDAERRRAFDLLEALQKEVRQPLTEWEEAEEARVEHHKAMIQHIKDCGLGMIGGQPQPYELLFRELEEKIVIDATWEEFEAEAHRVKADVLAKLKTMFAEHQKREAEQAELVRLRAEAEAREQKDRDERIAREAAERAKQEAEAKARAEHDAAVRREAEIKAAADRAEREKAEAIERQKQAEARAEAEKLAAEQRAKEAAEAARQAEIDRVAREKAEAEAQQRRREANREHRANINRTALQAFIDGGMPEDCAKQAVTLIAKGAIPAVSINY